MNWNFNVLQLAATDVNLQNISSAIDSASKGMSLTLATINDSLHTTNILLTILIVLFALHIVIRLVKK